MRTAAKKEVSYTARNELVLALREKAREAVGTLRTPDGYLQMLERISVFPQYSLYGLLLIGNQMPEATMLAEYDEWKKLRRHVKAGEHAIRILVPVALCGAADSGAENQAPRRIAGYALRRVFDISQTDGRPLPAKPDLQSAMMTADSAAAVTDAVKEITGAPFDAAGRTGGQLIRFAAQETAGTVLHGEGSAVSEEDRILEAKSVAHIVCRFFGFPAPGIGLKSIREWGRWKTDGELEGRLKEVKRAASHLIDAICRRLAGAA